MLRRAATGSPRSPAASSPGQTAPGPRRLTAGTIPRTRHAPEGETGYRPPALLRLAQPGVRRSDRHLVEVDRAPAPGSQLDQPRGLIGGHGEVGLPHLLAEVAERRRADVTLEVGLAESDRALDVHVLVRRRLGWHGA